MSILKTIYLQHLNGANANMTLDSSGRVGIGTSSPTSTLSVNGYMNDISISGTGEGLQVQRGDGNPYEAFIGTNTNNYNPGLVFRSSYHRWVNLNNTIQFMGIDSSGRVTKTSQPAFGAYSAGTGNYTTSANSVIPIAGGMRYNIGNHYNTSTSAFTAPVAGIYVFCFIGYNNGSGERIRICINGGSAMGQGSRNGAGVDWEQTVISSLAAGDSVDVRSVYGGGTIYLSSGHTEFAGYLLG